jgi:hypothetical protein
MYYVVVLHRHVLRLKANVRIGRQLSLASSSPFRDEDLQKRASRTPWAGRLKWRCGRGRAALLDRQMWIQREERRRALSKSTATYGCTGSFRLCTHARTPKIFEGNKESLAPGLVCLGDGTNCLISSRRLGNLSHKTPLKASSALRSLLMILKPMFPANHLRSQNHS